MKNLFFILFMAVSFVACSPKNASTTKTNVNHKADIQTAFRNLISLTNTGDWEKVIDAAYPKLFDIAPRETMIQQFQSMDMMGIKMNTKNVKFGEITDIIKDGDEQFAKMNYTGVQEITINSDDETLIETFKSGMEMQAGKENVTSTGDNTFNINLDKTVYCIKQKDSDKWHFLELNSGVEQILPMLLSQSIIDKLNKL